MTETTHDGRSWAELREHVLSAVDRFDRTVERIWQTVEHLREAISDSEKAGRAERDAVRAELAAALRAIGEQTNALRESTEERLRSIETRCSVHRGESARLSTRTYILWGIVAAVGVALTSALATAAMQALTQ